MMSNGFGSTSAAPLEGNRHAIVRAFFLAFLTTRRIGCLPL